MEAPLSCDAQINILRALLHAADQLQHKNLHTMCYHMDNNQDRTQILHAGEMLLLSSRLPPVTHARCAAAATAPATIDPVLADDLAWAIKVVSVTHGIQLAKLDHWRRTQSRTLQRVTSAGVEGGLCEVFTYYFGFSCLYGCS